MITSLFVLIEHCYRRICVAYRPPTLQRNTLRQIQLQSIDKALGCHHISIANSQQQILTIEIQSRKSSLAISHYSQINRFGHENSLEPKPEQSRALNERRANQTTQFVDMYKSLLYWIQIDTINSQCPRQEQVCRNQTKVCRREHSTYTFRRNSHHPKLVYSALCINVLLNNNTIIGTYRTIMVISGGTLSI